MAGQHFVDDGRPFAIEVFAGSARLTRHLEAVGFSGIGIDWHGSRHRAEGPVILLDLTSADGQQGLHELMRHPRLAFVHMAPVCGTASRAREKRLPGLPGGGPPPLRTAQYPRGLPDLDARLPRASRKVRAANVLYDFVVDIATGLTLRKVPWTMENPGDSLFWYLPEVIGLLQPGVEDVFFHHCMHGGQRDKRTRLRCFPQGAFSSLAAECDGNHVHLPWGFRKSTGSFATSDEAEYPQVLCERLAAAARDAAATENLAPFPSPSRSHLVLDPPAPPQDPRVATRISAATQPRGAKHPHVVRMFQSRGVFSVSSVDLPTLSSWVGITLPTDIVSGDVRFQKGGKVVQVESKGAPGPDLHPPSRLPLEAWRSEGFPGEGVVYVARRFRTKEGTVLPESRWSNPFRVSEYGRHECLVRYSAHLRNSEGFPATLAELAGKRLVCHCAATLDCHVDILIREFVAAFRRDSRCEVTFDVPWDTDGFVEQALRAEHPFEKLTCPEVVLRNARAIVEHGPDALARVRLGLIEYWRRRALALEPAEQALKDAMHPDVRGVVSGKRLLLLGEMLASAGFPCARRVVSSMSEGFTVAGPIAPTGAFPQFHRAAARCVDDLASEAQAARRALASPCRLADDPDLEQAVYDETQAEVKKGWLRGPVSADALDERFQWWLPAKRFGIRQGKKIRAVDDYSVFGHNEATGTSERIDVGGVDSVVSIARGMMQVYGMRPPAHARDQDATSVQGLVGKLWDLSSAYRQLPRHPEQAHLSIICVGNPTTGRPEFYEQLALPFGATAAVYHFNMVARGILAILTKIFGICACHYFDDYSVLEREDISDCTQRTVDSVLDLLGWATKEQVPFSPIFEPLGVVVDLSLSAAGTVVVRNKEARVCELREAVSAASASGALSPQDARRLRGRFVFARAQAFGRCGAPALRLLGNVADARDIRGRDVPLALASLRRLAAILSDAPPRRVSAFPRRPIVLFVDGACDPGTRLPRVGLGACIFDPVDGTSEFFGCEAGAELVGAWADRPDQQVIGQAELAPVLLAASTWHAKLLGRPALVFIDNDSARYGLVAGYSPVLASAALISATWSRLSRLGCAAWFARVPTVCNPADGPSRGDFKAMEARPRATKVAPSLDGAEGSRLWQAVADTLAREIPHR